MPPTDIPPSFLATYGLSGAVILALVAALLWVFRQVLKGHLVPGRHYDRLVAAREEDRRALGVALSALEHVTGGKDLGVELLQALRREGASERPTERGRW